ncbi:MAG: UvrD-helicase domain-containing protein, partial [Lachnospiraceae bacterium]|nr:UvrD-helicase domain-containing protein [Lachnospiraceae bacterium]
MPNQITKAQERAIKHHKGACLCLAGPGSGKTFVITNRVVHMVRELQIPSEHILVITFTKAAAMEMEERFQKILPDEHAWFGTFHSCFYYILKNSYTSIPNRFISTEEKHRILHEICDEILVQEPDIALEDVERLLGLYMNNGLSMQHMQEFADVKPEYLREIYRKYHKALIEYGYMDFDDLMLRTYQLLKEHAEVRARWQEQFRYILIDECQDMNVLQYEIIKLLAGREKNVFMVGDDDQSVYRFRGAKVELMQRFIEEYTPV